MHGLKNPRVEARKIGALAQWLRTVGLALALAGCGGGVDSGGTGSVPSTFAVGPITGFGSVIVNGVRFDDSAAAVSDDDGTPRSRDALRLGMTTEIRGSAISTDSTGAAVSTASSIAFGSDLLGPVDKVDLAAKRLLVLGQTVDVNGATVFDDASLAGGLAVVAVGDRVEVYALFDVATGRYTATRIERKAAVAAYRLRGVVSQLDAVAKAFNIGGERISYAGVGEVPLALANGNLVRLRLEPVRVGGVWRLAGLRDGAPKPRDLDAVRLEGRVSAFTSPTLFSVNGVAVDASAIGSVTGLVRGARVEVEGTVAGNVLVASKLKVKSDDDADNQEFELRGAITSVDAANLRFVLRGVTVSYTLSGSATEFRNGTAAKLAPGVDVEARGVLSGDGARLLAARISFK